ncbi:MAG: 3-methyl-2-oxobutanoate hydroxymethyltransferase, partial [Leptospiraceae bacterium]|nr:3-methyl-2-oxobutanoate hydroxymethyltransferase [Leptospiraceae bacterium]
ILVGDSLGMVIQGHESTVPVTLDEMIYHTKAVKRGNSDTPVICDLPFLSYQKSVPDGIESAGRVMKESFADAIKIEGASSKVLVLIKELTEMGIPVVGHLGLTPQSYQVLGGYKVQGKDEESAEKMLEDALSLEEAGVFSIVLEMIPESLGQKITKSLKIPTIGIGAGRHTSGQVLVIYDLLGMNTEFKPRFLKKYAELGKTIRESLNKYSIEVKKGGFPGSENIF